MEKFAYRDNRGNTHTHAKKSTREIFIIFVVLFGKYNFLRRFLNQLFVDMSNLNGMTRCIGQCIKKCDFIF
jgi:hypothetical protein